MDSEALKSECVDSQADLELLCLHIKNESNPFLRQISFVPQQKLFYPSLPENFVRDITKIVLRYFDIISEL